MALYGYARVSSTDQDLSLQEAALRVAGCQVVRAEKKTGTSRHGRAELDILLQFLRPGDTLVVIRIDRLARSLKDLQDIVHELTAKGVTLKAIEQPVDTSTAAGKAFFDMLGVFAEFETNLRRERQMGGLPQRRRAAPARGASRRSTRTRSASCTGKKGSVQLPSPGGSGSRGRRSTGFCRRQIRQAHNKAQKLSLERSQLPPGNLWVHPLPPCA